MTKQFVVVRIYREDYDHYKSMGDNMENDIYKMTGKKIKVSLPMVFKFITPQFNRRFIEVNLSQLRKEIEGRRGRK